MEIIIGKRYRGSTSSEMCTVTGVTSDAVTVRYDGDNHDTEFTTSEFRCLFYRLES